MKTPRIPWVLTPDALRPYAPGVWDPDTDPAELYYLPDDFTQARDLAADHPEKVAELRELFWTEAEKYKVLPLLATLSAFFGIVPPIPDVATIEYRGDVQNIMSGDDPADLQPLLCDQRGSGRPGRRRRGRDRDRGRPPGRVLALPSRTANSRTSTR
jgi:hypothetical protein